MLLPTTAGGTKVSQGVIGNGVGTPATPNPLPSFSDVFVNVQASAQFGSTVSPLFSGSYEFNASTGQYLPSGDFATNSSVIPVITPSSNSNLPEYTLGFQQDILGGAFDAPVGQQFTVLIDSSMRMGDPSNPSTFDFSSSSSHGGVIGAGGSVTGTFLLQQPSFLHRVGRSGALDDLSGRDRRSRLIDATAAA